MRRVVEGGGGGGGGVLILECPHPTTSIPHPPSDLIDQRALTKETNWGCEQGGGRSYLWTPDGRRLMPLT